MWKRLLHVVPSFVAGTLIRANRIAPMLNISEYRFSSLLSVDRYLDRSGSNLRFTPEEIDQALEIVRACDPEIEMILQPVTPYGVIRKPPTPEQILNWQFRAKQALKRVRVIPQTHKIMGQI